jgi:hypothetical protein
MEDAFAARCPADDVARLLTEARSCVVEVVNETAHPMRRLSATALHGTFVTQPAALVPAGATDAFGMQNRPRGIGLGCEGSVAYAIGADATLTLYLDNPFAGRNFAGAQFCGPRMLEYSCDARAGEGDSLVRVRFVVGRKECK